MPVERDTPPQRMPSFVRKLKIIGFLTTLVAVAVLFVTGSEGFYVQWRLQRQIDELQQENTHLRVLITTEKHRVYQLENDMSTIERIACERYGMARPGERVYRIVQPRTHSQQANSDAD